MLKHRRRWKDRMQTADPERYPLVVVREVVRVATFHVDNQWRRAGNLVRVSASWDQEDKVAEMSKISRKMRKSVSLVI